jgi:chromatin structure-remodeling complex subunit RSC1/2
MSGTSSNAPLPSPVANQTPSQTSYGQQFAAARPSASPAPLPHQTSYGSQGSAPHGALPQTPLYQPHTNFNSYASSAPTPAAQPNPLANYNQYHTGGPPRPAVPVSTSHTSHTSHSTNAYNPPRPVEVYTLAEAANASIPADIRAQFHHDEYGKVIFFTAPPLDVNPVPEQTQSLGHSLHYLADKARHEKEDEKKRKARAVQLETAAKERLKRMKADDEGKKHWIFDQKVNALKTWSEDMDKGTDGLYKRLHGDNWKQMRELDQYRLAIQQEEAFNKQKELEKFQRDSKENKDVKITGFKWI